MTADNPDNRVFEQLMCQMYGKHPIRIPILGTKETIGRITPQVLYDCHKAFYRPSNMLLCVVGDVSPEQVCALAAELLGSEKHPAPEKEDTWQEDMTCLSPYGEMAMEVACPMFQLGFKCEPAGRGAEAVRQEIIGDLAAEALFGESSALYLKLYEEGVIDSSFGGGFESVDGMSFLTASGDSEDPQAVRTAILEQAKTLLETGISREDFLRMKRSALGRRIRDLDSFDSTAFRICAYWFSGFEYFDYPAVFASVTEQEVCEFVRRVVTEERCSLSVIQAL